MLSPIDLVIVLVYIIGTTLLGAWFTRRQKDTRTYFVDRGGVRWNNVGTVTLIVVGAVVVLATAGGVASLIRRIGK